jgi:hypothetical protein
MFIDVSKVLGTFIDVSKVPSTQSFLLGLLNAYMILFNVYTVLFLGETQDVDGRIILRWIFRKLEGVVCTGWSWLRIGTGGRHL